MERGYFVQQRGDAHLMLMLWCIEGDADADEHMMLVHMSI
jgi:hypothetical protein